MKTDARILSLAVLNERRKRAVELREGGMILRAVAAEVGLSVPTVMAACRAYKEGGWETVKVKPRGRKPGEGRQLTAAQEYQVYRLICDKTPDQLEMGAALWNRKLVAKLVYAELGILLPTRTVGEYLKRWGFTPPASIKRECERCPEEVVEWLNKEYPRIAAQAKMDHAEIYWGSVLRLHSSRSEAVLVPKVDVYTSLNIVSAVTNKGNARWKVISGAFRANLMIDFFTRVVNDSAKNVYLIFDDVRAYRGRKLRNWLALNKRVKVFLAPSRSPRSNSENAAKDSVDGISDAGNSLSVDGGDEKPEE